MFTRIPKRTPRQLKLGNHYIVYWQYNKKMICKFIQPTKKGFNLLNIESNRCILNQHVYPSTYDNHSNGNWFFINENLRIEKVK